MNCKINEVAPMGYGDEDYFNSLSRKELQDLCRKNGLPSNKTKPYLAKLLASCYQRNNVSSRSSMERSSSLMNDWPFTRPVLHSKHDSHSNPVGEQNKDFVGVHEIRARAAGIDSQPPSISSKAIPVSTMNVVHRDPSMNGTAEVYGCSRFDIQETSLCSLVGSQCGDSAPKLDHKDSSESPETREYKQNMAGYARSTGSGLLPQSRCKNMNLPESHTDTRFISSNGTNQKLLPDFEFYVRSEEGINLFVDLNSSPSDWIRNLNNDVCIRTEPMNNKPWALHHELKSLEDGLEKDEKASLLENTAVDLKNNGDHVYTKCSTVRERNVQDQSDAVDRSLRHIAAMQVSTPVDTQMSTSLSEPISDVQKVMNICTKSSPQNSEKFPQGLEVTLTSPVNLTGDHVMGSNSDGLKSPGSLEHRLRSDKSGSENPETGSVGISSVSYINRLTLNNEILAAIKPISGMGVNGIRPFSGCSTTGRSIVMQLSEGGSLSEYMSNSLLRNGGAPDPDNEMHDLQYEIGVSANSELDLNRGLDSLSEEQRRSTLTNETEISEYFQFDPKNCKRSHSSESEGLQNKRLHSHTEDGNNPAIKDLRNAKDLAREAFPRRSMRLVSKVKVSVPETFPRCSHFHA